MRKPEFEQLRHSLIRAAKAMPQQEREPYRQKMVSMLEEDGLLLVQRARKDGHDDALIEVHASWIGTDYSTEAIIGALKTVWARGFVEGGQLRHWIESEDEVVTLEFAWSGPGSGFLTGRVKVTLG